MASRFHSPWRALSSALLVLAAALAPTVAVAGEPPATDTPEAAATAAAPHTVVVGKARLTWHLQPAAAVKRSALVDSFRKATTTHLTGDEPHLTPQTEPVTLPGGQLRLPIPAELIHTMFVSADGRTYCSDSTVTAKAAPVRSTDQEDR